MFYPNVRPQQKTFTATAVAAVVLLALVLTVLEVFQGAAPSGGSGDPGYASSGSAFTTTIAATSR